MTRSLELLVWQAIGRTPELPDALEVIGPRVLEQTGGTTLFLRAFDLDQQRIETLAAFDGHAARPASAVQSLPDLSLGELITWSRGRQLILAARRTDHPLAPLLLPKEVKAALAAAPLSRDAGSPPGALVLAGPAASVLSNDAQAVLRTLTEPLAVALANDRRLHRLERAAEANEADKRALLSRLERQDISESVVGGEAGLREVTERVHQVAPTDAPVLILGETGAGKEVVARSIHSQSKRAGGPMVRVNCGAIPAQLIDSELFGHEQGSFTGAVNRRKGWFERADGGTLFLDEIGELPPAAQVRLLRVLQDGTIDRVGAQKSITVDVRIVAATHRDLEEMVRAGSFRQDLWYRIGVFPIHLPPLRERLEDIPALAAHFARRAGKRLGGMPLSLSADDISLLVSYPWPGNVRELAAVIERAAILGNGQRLEVAAALGVARQASPPRGAPAPPAPARLSTSSARAPAATSGDVATTLDAAMAEHIEAALARSHGRIDGPFGAAKALGINPHTLRARMRKLGVEWRKFRGADRLKR